MHQSDIGHQLWYNAGRSPLSHLDSQRIKWAANHQKVDTPSWDIYFMSFAILASSRSQDSQNQNGCVIVKDRVIVGPGYNSFPKNLNDSYLPNIRPLKQRFMSHAESNCLRNISVNNLQNSDAYITSFPCLDCLIDLYSKDVKSLYVLPNKSSVFNSYTDHEKSIYLEIITVGGVTIHEFDEDDLKSITALLFSASKNPHLKLDKTENAS